ncbi:MAG: hypothetical protein J7L37_08320 [Thermococcus sp.]|nr:hypothetical protein [Thermococcus sp.]
MGTLAFIGGTILFISSFIGLLEPTKWFKHPEFGKLGVIDQMKESAIILIGIVAGNIILFFDPEWYAEVPIWMLALSSLAFTFALVSLGINYRRLKRFEQEEMLERLAEKMGEKLGESMAKGIKAKES